MATQPTKDGATPSGQPAGGATPPSPAVSAEGAHQAQSIADVLDKAADLIAAPGAWFQGEEFARDASGTPIWNSDDGFSTGVSFCGAGAITHVCGGYTALRGEAIRAVGEVGTAVSFIRFNETPGRTQKQVVAKLRKAAAKARAEAVA